MRSTISIRAFTIMALLAFWATLSGSAAALDATVRRCDARRFPQVVLNLAVTREVDGEAGQPIDSPLGIESFRCTENERPVDDSLTLFPPGEGSGVRGADVVFLIDASGSMADKIEEVRSNVKGFADQLAALDLTTGLKLGLVRFGGGDGDPFVANNGSLTSDVEQFKGFIDQLGAQGGYEPGFTALREAVTGFDFQAGTQKIFILISDEDSDSEDGFNHADDPEKQRTIELLLENEVRVFVAVDCDWDFARSDYCDETSVTAATGGTQFAVTDPLDDIIPEIVQEIGDTYVVRYHTPDLTLDGKARTVRCAVSLDGEEDTVECTYVPKSAPEIDLTLETKGLTARRLERGETPTIGAVVTDAAEPFVQSVVLFYRTTGAAGYSSVAMTEVAEDRYEAVLPPVAPPGVDFYVRASDGEETTALPSGEPANEPFQIAVQPNSAPFISHNPGRRRSGGQNQSVTISAFVRDQTQSLAGVELRWRNQGDLFYERMPMARISAQASTNAVATAMAAQDETEGTYVAAIPAGRVTAEIEYYIRATDDQGVSATVGTPDEPCPDCQIIRGTIAIRPRDARTIPHR